MTAARTIAIALALLATACGGSRENGTGTTTPEADPTVSRARSDLDDPAPEGARGAEPGPAGVEADPVGSRESILTASHRGVTESAIQVGVALLDSRPFVDNGDVGARVGALADEINDRGGILGRRLELHIEEFGVLDELGFEAACTRHTEDEHVFVAITFAFSMDLTCYGGLHDTNVINMIEISENDVTGSSATVLSVAADPLHTLLRGLDLLAGDLAGTPVAVHVRPEREADLAPVRAHLADLGAEVVVETIATVYFDDIPADQVQHDVFHERWLASGAEAVVAIGRGASSAAIGAVDRAGSDLLVVVQGNEANSLEAFGSDLGEMNLVAIAPTSIELAAEQGLYGVSDCIELIETRTGQTITIAAPVGEPQPLFSTIAACQAMELLELIATGAGPDLTNSTWRRTAESLGSFELTGTPRASLAPGRPHVSRPDVALYDYDDSRNGFVARG